MSVIRRLLGIFGWRSKYVGKDLYGNKFYEYPSTTEDPRRTRRIVKYVDQGKITEYATGGLKLPVQWSAWLAHTRREPPSIEELFKDNERQRVVQHNAQLLALRDAQSHRLQIEDTAPLTSQHSDQPRIEPLNVPQPPGQHRNPLPRKSFQTAQKPSTPDSDYTPQAWSPAAVTRR